MYRRIIPRIKGITIVFERGVKEFMTFAVEHALLDKIRCPCLKCTNRKYQDPIEVEIHLYRFRFVGNYNRWICHGESYESEPRQPSLIPRDTIGETGLGDRIREMVLDATGPELGSFKMASTIVDEPPNSKARKFYDMLEAINTPIWEGRTSHSQLSLVSQLLNIKSKKNMSGKCFN
jgi:hypothetical protein